MAVKRFGVVIGVVQYQLFTVGYAYNESESERKCESWKIPIARQTLSKYGILMGLKILSKRVNMNPLWLLCFFLFSEYYQLINR